MRTGYDRREHTHASHPDTLRKNERTSKEKKRNNKETITRIIHISLPFMRVIYVVQCTEWSWKLVLLTLAASRGVTDLCFTRIKHRTRANGFLCETEH